MPRVRIKVGGWKLELLANTVESRIIKQCAMSLELPPLVFFFLTPRGAEQLLFCRDFHPFSEVGNSRLHSTLFNYSRFYGILEGRKTPLQQEFCHCVFFAFLKRCTSLSRLRSSDF